MSTTQEFTAVNPDADERRQKNEPKQLLNVRETARTLQVHENTVRNLVKRGELQAVRLPGSGYKRFLRADVERMRDDMFRGYEHPTSAGQERDAKPDSRLTQDDYRAPRPRDTDA